MQDEPFKSNTRRAVHDLRELIFSGELEAGSDHLESELAERLSMSRTPVREATLMLEAQGLLEVRPRKGVRILALSADDMDEIYEVLTELESLAAALAADAQYCKKDLNTLAKSIDDMEVAVTNEDRVAWAKADGDFHHELVRLSKNSRIMAIVSNFNDQVRRARMTTLHIRPLPKKSNEEHRALFEAIVSGDAKAARDIHWNHRTSARKMLTELLNGHGLKRI
ncbi:GntR family transcriptional regulator [Amylibacter sp. SFDW26]|nr:GntR family transcriptional regulator [Amylibacter sp. SFDW26]